MNTDPKYEKLALALLLILLLGFLATVSGRLIPIVYPGIDLGHVNSISAIWAAVYAVLRVIVDIGGGEMDLHYPWLVWRIDGSHFVCPFTDLA